MPKKSVFIILIFLIAEIILLINPNILINSLNGSINLFVSKLFISLFPFFVLNEVILEYNFGYYISKLKINFLSKIFKISNTSTSIIILSLLTGHPSNAKYIKDYLNKGLIDENEATKLLTFSFLPSPVFVVTTIGYLMFSNILIGVILLLNVYIVNFLIGIFIRNKIQIKTNNTSILNNSNNSFSNILKTSITNTFNTLFLILGNIIIYSLFLNIVNNYINIHPIFNSLLSSIIEITGGIKKISIISANFSLKYSFVLFSLIFSGFSIYSQATSILIPYKVNIKFIFKYKLIFSVFSSIISYLLLNLLF